MKVFKYILISFGVVALAFGITFLVFFLQGKFDQEVIKPEDISIEISGDALAYNDGKTDYLITETNLKGKATSTTVGVTEDVVKLSLGVNELSVYNYMEMKLTTNFSTYLNEWKNNYDIRETWYAEADKCFLRDLFYRLVEGPDDAETFLKSYITDGAVVVPQSVKIGQEFDVILVQNEDGIATPKKSYNAGGISSIVATTSNVLISKSKAVNIAVDVPVDKVEVKFYENNAEVTDIKAGVTYDLVPSFTPSASGKDALGNNRIVYYSIPSEEIDGKYYEFYNVNGNVNYSKVHILSDSGADSFSINAIVATVTNAETLNLKEMGDVKKYSEDEDKKEYFCFSSTNKQSSKLEVVSLSSNKMQQQIKLYVRRPVRLFANHDSSDAYTYNMGLNVNTSSSVVYSKLTDLYLIVLQRKDNDYIDSTNVEFSVPNFEVETKTFYKNSDGKYLLERENSTDKEYIGYKIIQSQDPKESYWDICLKENLSTNYQFIPVLINGTNNVIPVSGEENCVHKLSYDQITTVSPNISNITFDYNGETELVVVCSNTTGQSDILPTPIALSSYAHITNANSDYKVIKYFVAIDSNTGGSINLCDYFANCSLYKKNYVLEKSSNYYDVYELKEGTLSPTKALEQSVNVFVALVNHDNNLNPVKGENEEYDFISHSTMQTFKITQTFKIPTDFNVEVKDSTTGTATAISIEFNQNSGKQNYYVELSSSTGFEPANKLALYKAIKNGNFSLTTTNDAVSFEFDENSYATSDAFKFSIFAKNLPKSMFLNNAGNLITLSENLMWSYNNGKEVVNQNTQTQPQIIFKNYTRVSGKTLTYSSTDKKFSIEATEGWITFSDLLAVNQSSYTLSVIQGSDYIKLFQDRLGFWHAFLAKVPNSDQTIEIKAVGSDATNSDAILSFTLTGTAIQTIGVAAKNDANEVVSEINVEGVFREQTFTISKTTCVIDKSKISILSDGTVFDQYCTYSITEDPSTSTLTLKINIKENVLSDISASLVLPTNYGDYVIPICLTNITKKSGIISNAFKIKSGYRAQLEFNNSSISRVIFDGDKVNIGGTVSTDASGKTIISGGTEYLADAYVDYILKIKPDITNPINASYKLEVESGDDYIFMREKADGSYYLGFTGQVTGPSGTTVKIKATANDDSSNTAEQTFTFISTAEFTETACKDVYSSNPCKLYYSTTDNVTYYLDCSSILGTDFVSSAIVTGTTSSLVVENAGDFADHKFKFVKLTTKGSGAGLKINGTIDLTSSDSTNNDWKTYTNLGDMEKIYIDGTVGSFVHYSFSSKNVKVEWKSDFTDTEGYVYVVTEGNGTGTSGGILINVEKTIGKELTGKIVVTTKYNSFEIDVCIKKGVVANRNGDEEAMTLNSKESQELKLTVKDSKGTAIDYDQSATANKWYFVLNVKDANTNTWGSDITSSTEIAEYFDYDKTNNKIIFKDVACETLYKLSVRVKGDSTENPAFDYDYEAYQFTVSPSITMELKDYLDGEGTEDNPYKYDGELVYYSATGTPSSNLFEFNRYKKDGEELSESIADEFKGFADKKISFKKANSADYYDCSTELSGTTYFIDNTLLKKLGYIEENGVLTSSIELTMHVTYTYLGKDRTYEITFWIKPYFNLKEIINYSAGSAFKYNFEIGADKYYIYQGVVYKTDDNTYVGTLNNGIVTINSATYLVEKNYVCAYDSSTNEKDTCTYSSGTLTIGSENYTVDLTNNEVKHTDPAGGEEKYKISNKRFSIGGKNYIIETTTLAAGTETIIFEYYPLKTDTIVVNGKEYIKFVTSGYNDSNGIIEFNSDIGYSYEISDNMGHLSLSSNKLKYRTGINVGTDNVCGQIAVKNSSIKYVIDVYAMQFDLENLFVQDVFEEQPNALSEIVQIGSSTPNEIVLGLSGGELKKQILKTETDASGNTTLFGSNPYNLAVSSFEASESIAKFISKINADGTIEYLPTGKQVSGLITLCLSNGSTKYYVNFKVKLLKTEFIEIQNPYISDSVTILNNVLEVKKELDIDNTFKGTGTIDSFYNENNKLEVKNGRLSAKLYLFTLDLAISTYTLYSQTATTINNGDYYVLNKKFTIDATLQKISGNDIKYEVCKTDSAKYNFYIEVSVKKIHNYEISLLNGTNETTILIPTKSITNKTDVQEINPFTNGDLNNSIHNFVNKLEAKDGVLTAKLYLFAENRVDLISTSSELLAGEMVCVMGEEYSIILDNGSYYLNLSNSSAKSIITKDEKGYYVVLQNVSFNTNEIVYVASNTSSFSIDFLLDKNNVMGKPRISSSFESESEKFSFKVTKLLYNNDEIETKQLGYYVKNIDENGKLLSSKFELANCPNSAYVEFEITSTSDALTKYGTIAKYILSMTKQDVDFDVVIKNESSSSTEKLITIAGNKNANGKYSIELKDADWAVKTVEVNVKTEIKKFNSDSLSDGKEFLDYYVDNLSNNKFDLYLCVLKDIPGPIVFDCKVKATKGTGAEAASRIYSFQIEIIACDTCATDISSTSSLDGKINEVGLFKCSDDITSIVGSVDGYTYSDITLPSNLILKEGSILKSDSTIASGSTINDASYNSVTTLTQDLEITQDSTLVTGSSLKSGSIVINSDGVYCGVDGQLANFVEVYYYDKYVYVQMIEDLPCKSFLTFNNCANLKITLNESSSAYTTSIEYLSQTNRTLSAGGSQAISNSYAIDTSKKYKLDINDDIVGRYSTTNADKANDYVKKLYLGNYVVLIFKETDFPNDYDNNYGAIGVSVNILKTNSKLKSGSVIGKGSIVNGIEYTSRSELSDDLSITMDSFLVAGSKIESGSTIAYNSTINGTKVESATTSISGVTINSGVLNDDLTINDRAPATEREGALLTKGSVLKAGSTIASGSTINGLKFSGSQLTFTVTGGSTITIDTSGNLSDDLTITQNSILATGSVIKNGSTIEKYSIIESNLKTSKIDPLTDDANIGKNASATLGTIYYFDGTVKAKIRGVTSVDISEVGKYYFWIEVSSVGILNDSLATSADYKDYVEVMTSSFKNGTSDLVEVVVDVKKLPFGTDKILTIIDTTNSNKLIINLKKYLDTSSYGTGVSKTIKAFDYSLSQTNTEKIMSLKDSDFSITRTNNSLGSASSFGSPLEYTTDEILFNQSNYFSAKLSPGSEDYVELVKEFNASGNYYTIKVRRLTNNKKANTGNYYLVLYDIYGEHDIAVSVASDILIGLGNEKDVIGGDIISSVPNHLDIKWWNNVDLTNGTDYKIEKITTSNDKLVTIDSSLNKITFANVTSEQNVSITYELKFLKTAGGFSQEETLIKTVTYTIKPRVTFSSTFIATQTGLNSLSSDAVWANNEFILSGFVNNLSDATANANGMTLILSDNKGTIEATLGNSLTTTGVTNGGFNVDTADGKITFKCKANEVCNDTDASITLKFKGSDGKDVCEKTYKVTVKKRFELVMNYETFIDATGEYYKAGDYELCYSLTQNSMENLFYSSSDGYKQNDFSVNRVKLTDLSKDSGGLTLGTDVTLKTKTEGGSPVVFAYYTPAGEGIKYEVTYNSSDKKWLYTNGASQVTAGNGTYSFVFMLSGLEIGEYNFYVTNSIYSIGGLAVDKYVKIDDNYNIIVPTDFSSGFNPFKPVYVFNQYISDSDGVFYYTYDGTKLSTESEYNRLKFIDGFGMQIPESVIANKEFKDVCAKFVVDGNTSVKQLSSTNKFVFIGERAYQFQTGGTYGKVVIDSIDYYVDSEGKINYANKDYEVIENGEVYCVTDNGTENYYVINETDLGTNNTYRYFTRNNKRYYFAVKIAGATDWKNIVGSTKADSNITALNFNESSDKQLSNFSELGISTDGDVTVGYFVPVASTNKVSLFEKKYIYKLKYNNIDVPYDVVEKYLITSANNGKLAVTSTGAIIESGSTEIEKFNRTATKGTKNVDSRYLDGTKVELSFEYNSSPVDNMNLEIIPTLDVQFGTTSFSTTTETIGSETKSVIKVNAGQYGLSELTGIKQFFGDDFKRSLIKDFKFTKLTENNGVYTETPNTYPLIGGTQCNYASLSAKTNSAENCLITFYGSSSADDVFKLDLTLCDNVCETLYFKVTPSTDFVTKNNLANDACTIDADTDSHVYDSDTETTSDGVISYRTTDGKNFYKFILYDGTTTNPTENQIVVGNVALDKLYYTVLDINSSSGDCCVVKLSSTEEYNCCTEGQEVNYELKNGLKVTINAKDNKVYFEFNEPALFSKKATIRVFDSYGYYKDLSFKISVKAIVTITEDEFVFFEGQDIENIIINNKNIISINGKTINEAEKTIERYSFSDSTFFDSAVNKFKLVGSDCFKGSVDGISGILYVALKYSDDLTEMLEVPVKLKSKYKFNYSTIQLTEGDSFENVIKDSVSLSTAKTDGTGYDDVTKLSDSSISSSITINSDDIDLINDFGKTYMVKITYTAYGHNYICTVPVKVAKRYKKITINYGGTNTKKDFGMIDKTISISDWLKSGYISATEQDDNSIKFNTTNLCSVSIVSNASSLSGYTEAQKAKIGKSDDSNLVVNGIDGQIFKFHIEEKLETKFDASGNIINLTNQEEIQIVVSYFSKIKNDYEVFSNKIIICAVEGYTEPVSVHIERNVADPDNKTVTNITQAGKAAVTGSSLYCADKPRNFFSATYNADEQVSVSNESDLLNYMEYVIYYNFNSTSSPTIDVDATYTNFYQVTADSIAQNFNSLVSKLCMPCPQTIHYVISGSDSSFTLRQIYCSGTNIPTQTKAEHTSVGTYTQIDYAFKMPETTSTRTFKIVNYYGVSGVSTSDQLVYVLQNGFKPVCDSGTSAETVYIEAKKILGEICKDTMSDLEKVKAIYEWLILNVQYDNYAVSTPEVLQNWWNYRAWYAEGAIIDKVAVCDGISKAFVILASIEGIPTLRVTGTKDEGGSSVGHAWNKVLLDVDGDDTKEWYGIDATHGGPSFTDKTSSYETLTYTQFLFKDVWKEDKGWKVENLSNANFVCSTDYNFYDGSEFDTDSDGYVDFDLQINDTDEMKKMLTYYVQKLNTSYYVSVEFDYYETLYPETLKTTYATEIVSISDFYLLSIDGKYCLVSKKKAS